MVRLSSKTDDSTIMVSVSSACIREFLKIEVSQSYERFPHVLALTVVLVCTLPALNSIHCIFRNQRLLDLNLDFR